MPESTAPPSDGITDPNTVRPSADPREWPSDEQDTITPEKTPAQRTQSGTRTHTKAQTKKRQRDSLGLAHSHDHNQESNQENFKAKKSKSDRSKKPNEFGIDDIDDYFYPPIYGEGETEADGDPMYYECRWCRKVYKKGEGTRGNLVKHRDGDKHRTPCPRRTDAILAGANLPLTAKEIAAKKPEEENGVTLKSAAQDGKFDPKVFKQLILIWLIRNSLSWTHIDNPLLLSAFGYARADFKLYNSGAWAASETNKLHINLQGQIIRKLNNLVSKITLIHDVWSTKGIPHAFMGVSAAFVTADWKFEITHLGFKFIPRIQKRKSLAVPLANIITNSSLHTKITQTFDFDSHSAKLAAEVDELILQKTGTHFNSSDNHIQCFCRNISLILTAGLKAISIGEDGLIKSKKSTLGFLPSSVEIVDRYEDVELSDRFEENDGAENQQSEDEESQPRGLTSVNGGSKVAAASRIQGSQQSSVNKIKSVFKKIDFVIQKITGSVTKRAEFEALSKELDHSEPALVAGHGARWDIKFLSRDRAYQRRQIIDKLLKSEKERQGRHGGKNFYQDIEISEDDWEIVKEFNEVLSEFYSIIERMEGEISSAGMMFVEYRSLKTYLTKKMNESSIEIDFKIMFSVMIEQIEKNLTDALNCDLVLLATIVNPTYRLSMFQMWFPSHHPRAHTLIQTEFNKKSIDYNHLNNSTANEIITTDRNQHERGDQLDIDELELFPDSFNTSSTVRVGDELSVYLGGKYKWPITQVNQPLKWWKEHADEFPILSLLARDYLGCCSTTTSIEGCFSKAIDVCCNAQDGNTVRNIERYVDSDLWLFRNRIYPVGELEIPEPIFT
ncbi:hypothetical protein PSTT_11468 [Puccinia striiformis]|uniref:HAT C-terminal dimerisation domain-containing protein n=1 Tax=Puccinia striiformis TaxID=27350 RepID=A0A2S4V055_9BASI|nr:hypothetical protein PSTT_11468 [Puccinia striiformis]